MCSAPANAATAAVLDPPLPDDPLDSLKLARSRTLALIDGISEADLARQIDRLMSPLLWDLAHIAAFEDLWLAHRHGGRELLHPELTEVYDAFETPRPERGDIPLLDLAQTLQYLDDVRARTLASSSLKGVDAALYEMVLQHELQHTETMLQTMRLGELAPWLDRLPEASASAAAAAFTEVSDATALLGAAASGQFAYDNELPQHRVELSAFRIASRPTSVAQWREFVDGGGYDDRSNWSDAGWRWRGQHTASAFEQDDLTAPVCHLSFFEAEAFANWHGMRLPTEAEWEHAARAGALAGIGEVWEWTSSEFSGYPGFLAHPYPEYSEVFFDDGYRVLRGGSFATHPRVKRTTFRNWDNPARQQLFAGVRLAGDPE